MSHLSELIAAELALPVDPRVSGFADHIANQYPASARAVLFYGSCLRLDALDGQMLDFYLIVSDYRAAYGDSWLVRANRMLPPNVFPFEFEGLVAKVAVLSEADFTALNLPAASAVSVWARFAQPSRLVWTKDALAREHVIGAVRSASITLFSLTLPLLVRADKNQPLTIWRKGFELTYGAELRAERANRPGSVVDADEDRYRKFGAAVLVEMPDRLISEPEARRRWAALRRNGKLLTLARLAKASGTYAGGIDYLAWKINRHAGTEYVIRDWQRNWPILGALVMLPRLILGGAIK